MQKIYEKSLHYIFFHGILVAGREKHIGGNMADSLYRLIALEPNSLYRNGLEERIRSYCEDRKNEFFTDPYQIAWMDPRIGGLRTELETGTNFANQYFGYLYSEEQFKTFKQRVLETYRLRLKNLEEKEAKARQRKKELEDKKQKNQLTKKEERDLKNIGLFLQSLPKARAKLNREIGKLELVDGFFNYAVHTQMAEGAYANPTNITDTVIENVQNDSHDGNRDQVRWVRNAVENSITNRNEVAQGISFALTNGTDLPIIDKDITTDIHQKIKNGLEALVRIENERSHHQVAADSIVPAFFMDVSKERQVELYNNLLTHCHAAQGYIQTYTNVIDAITQSPMFPVMQSYFVQRAKEQARQFEAEGKRDEAKKAWEEAAAWKNAGNIEKLLTHVKSSPDYKKSEFFDFYAYTLYPEKLKAEVVPTLQELEKLQQLYQFLAKKTNEFNAARRQYEASHQASGQTLVEELFKTPEYKDVYNSRIQTLTSQSYSASAYDTKILTDIAEVMLQKGAISEGLYATIRETIVFGVAAGAMGLTATIIPGSGLAVGLPVGAAAAIKTGEWIDSLHDWTTETDPFGSATWASKKSEQIGKWIADWKNADECERLRNILADQIKIENQYRDRLNNMQKEFPHFTEKNIDVFLEYALRHSNVDSEPVLMMIKQARSLKRLKDSNPTKYNELREQAKKDMNTALATLKEKPNDIKANNDFIRLGQAQVLFQCVETGNYFYLAQQTHSYMQQQIEKKNALFVVPYLSDKNYQDNEVKLFNDVYQVMQSKDAVITEYRNWAYIYNEWVNAGRPRIGEMGGKDVENVSYTEILTGNIFYIGSNGSQDRGIQAPTDSGYEAAPAPSVTPASTAQATPETPTVAPANTGTPAPANTGTPAPANTETPAPANTGTPAPANTGTPAPANTGTPAPANTGTPAPANTGTPAPANTETPAPANTGTPAPANTGTPAPANTGTPVPANTETPAPANTETPAPANTETPAPANTGTPAPANTGTPAPANTGTPAPANTETPAPTEVTMTEEDDDESFITIDTLKTYNDGIFNPDKDVSFMITGFSNYTNEYFDPEEDYFTVTAFSDYNQPDKSEHTNNTTAPNETKTIQPETTGNEEFDSENAPEYTTVSTRNSSRTLKANSNNDTALAYHETHSHNSTLHLNSTQINGLIQDSSYSNKTKQNA